MKKIRSINKEENGFASLVVAFIFILVLSLLTVGFAQVARSEQQDAVAKQLANQAYYAAESGVNDIRAELPALIANATAGGANPSTNPQFNGTACLNSTYLPSSTSYPTGMNDINPTDDVSYTCAIVNLTPAFLSIPSTSGIGSGNYIFSTATPLTQLSFSWGSDNTPVDNNPAPSSCGVAGCFPAATTWQSSANKYPPVVQVSITPINPTSATNTTGTFTRNELTASTFTAMLYPDNGGPYLSTGTIARVHDPYYSPSAACKTALGVGIAGENINYVPDGIYPDSSPCNALIVGSNYNNASGLTYPYSVTFNLAAAAPQANESWLVHYVWNYGGINSCIQAGVPTPPTSAGTPTACLYSTSNTATTQNFTGSQVVVDVTGKAKDVEKRVVEILPYPQGTTGSTSTQNGLATLPYYSLMSGDTCKEFATNPASPGGGGLAATNYDAGTTGSSACTLGPP